MARRSRRYPERPIVGVGVVVLRPGSVLLVRRGKHPGRGDWSLPGGAQEVGETVYETARREVREETGLAVDVLGLVDVVDSIRTDDQGRAIYHYTLVDVYGVVVGGQLKPGSDADAAEWFPIDQVPRLGLWSETERIIAEALDRWAAEPARGPAHRSRKAWLTDE